MKNLTTLHQLQQKRDTEIKRGQWEQSAYTSINIEGFLLGTIEHLEDTNALLLDIIRDLRWQVEQLEAEA